MAATLPLFDATDAPAPARVVLGAGAVLLRGFALDGNLPGDEPGGGSGPGSPRDAAAPLANALHRVLEQAPLRHLVTPGGQRMSVAMTNCGPLGWVSDRRGYRYAANDPQSGRPWPALPPAFRHLATQAAAAAGFDGFDPDACLVNRYLAGTRLSLHQDRDESDLRWPIVSVSLGMPAVFLFGGLRRTDPVARVPLSHGDVVVWGGPDRLRFHGVLPLKPAAHPSLGEQRYNLTFRRAG